MPTHMGIDIDDVSDEIEAGRDVTAAQAKAYMDWHSTLEYARGKQHGNDDLKLIEQQARVQGHQIMRLNSDVGRLKVAATKAIKIIDTNLYHQREKVEDAASLLRQALEPSNR